MAKPKHERPWQVAAHIYIECVTCGWSMDPSSRKQSAARAMDHARRNAHQVLMYRTTEHDFRPAAPASPDTAHPTGEQTDA